MTSVRKPLTILLVIAVLFSAVQSQTAISGESTISPQDQPEPIIQDSNSKKTEPAKEEDLKAENSVESTDQFLDSLEGTLSHINIITGMLKDLKDSLFAIDEKFDEIEDVNLPEEEDKKNKEENAPSGEESQAQSTPPAGTQAEETMKVNDQAPVVQDTKSESNDEVFSGKPRKTFHNIENMKRKITEAKEAKSSGKDLFDEGAKLADTASHLLEDLLKKTEGENEKPEDIEKLVKDLEEECTDLEKKIPEAKTEAKKMILSLLNNIE